MTVSKMEKILKVTLGWGFLLVFILIISSNAQQGEIQKTFPKKIVLENGLTLVYEKDASSQISVVQIIIRGGRHAEPEGKSGLAYLTTRLTLEIPDQTKIQKLMDQATTFYMECREGYSFTRISCLSLNLEESLEIASKILIKPLISNLRIDRIKDQMKHARNAAQDDPTNVAYGYYMDSFFSGSPYSGSAFGSEESLKSIKKKDITTFHQNQFLAGNMLIVVSSDLDEDKIRTMINQLYGKIPEGSAPSLLPIAKTLPEERLKTIEKEAQQAFISVGYLLPSGSPKDYMCSVMLQNILGKGVASKLWPLRDEEKLAYNVQSRFTLFADNGILEAYIETENTKQETALKSFKQVLNAVYTKGLTPEELDTNKSFTKASFLIQNETKQDRVGSSGFYETMGLGYDFFNKFFQTVDAITLEDLNTFIHKHLDPDKAVYVIIGPNDD